MVRDTPLGFPSHTLPYRCRISTTLSVVSSLLCRIFPLIASSKAYPAPGPSFFVGAGLFPARPGLTKATCPHRAARPLPRARYAPRPHGRAHGPCPTKISCRAAPMCAAAHRTPCKPCHCEPVRTLVRRSAPVPKLPGVMGVCHPQQKDRGICPGLGIF